MLEDVAKLLKLLESGSFRYCVIGGIAILAYGGRASTLDLDFFILAEDMEALLLALEKNGHFVRRLGADQAKARFGVIPVDILKADPWVGAPAIRRARKRKFLGSPTRIARPEDIIIMKSIADRPVDRRDIAELEEIFGSKLDRSYIRSRLAKIRKEMAE